MRFGAVILSVTILSILPGTSNGGKKTLIDWQTMDMKKPSIWIVSLCIKPRHSLVFLPALLLAILSEPWNWLKLMKWTKNGRWRTKEGICFFKFIFCRVFLEHIFVQDLLLTPGSISTYLLWIICLEFWFDLRFVGRLLIPASVWSTPVASFETWRAWL